MKENRNIHWPRPGWFHFSLLAALLFLSCDNDGPSPLAPDGTTEFGTVSVRVVDEYEKPFIQVRVGIVDENGEELENALTDDNGYARVDSVPPGEYDVRLEIDSRLMEWDAPDLSLEMKSIPVPAGTTVQKTLHIPVDPHDINVYTNLDSEESPLHKNVELSVRRLDNEFVLDSHGNGVLKDFMLRSNSITINVVRDGVRERALRSPFQIGPDGWPYLEIYVPSPPQVKITVPLDGTGFYGDMIPFIGTGYDIDDGELPGEGLTWSSDLDGVLGTGHTLLTPLSIGRHVITLTGRDSDNDQTKDSIAIDVSRFSSESYFPFPREGVWKYNIEAPELVMTTETGITQRWTLDDMTVISEELTSRTSALTWTIAQDDAVFNCQYTIKDYLSIDGNRIEVSATEELLEVYDGGELIEALSVNTEYTPYYPVMANYIDPYENTEEVTVLTAESTVDYTIAGIGTHRQTETETVTVSFNAASPEMVTIASVVFSTIPLASTYNNVERMWWLSRGIGIVKMEYDLFGETVTASLYETNMGDFSGGAGKLAALGGGSAPVRIQLDSSDAVARMRKIMNVMRGMCPR